MAPNRSRPGREIELPRFPGGLSVWFGKTQGRVCVRIPRTGCFPVACSLGFTAWNPGGILLGRASPVQPLRASPRSHWDARAWESSEQQAGALVTFPHLAMNQTRTTRSLFKSPFSHRRCLLPPRACRGPRLCPGGHCLRQPGQHAGDPGARSNAAGHRRSRREAQAGARRGDTRCHRAHRDHRGPARSTAVPPAGPEGRGRSRRGTWPTPESRGHAAESALPSAPCREPIAEAAHRSTPTQIYLYVHNRGKRPCCWDQSFNLMPLTPS